MYVSFSFADNHTTPHLQAVHTLLAHASFVSSTACCTLAVTPSQRCFHLPIIVCVCVVRLWVTNYTVQFEIKLTNLCCHVCTGGQRTSTGLKNDRKRFPNTHILSTIFTPTGIHIQRARPIIGSRSQALKQIVTYPIDKGTQVVNHIYACKISVW